jgi:hypothetical protein
MKPIPAVLLVLSVAACASPMGTEPTSPAEGALGASAQLKPATSLVIERISGDCATGLTVRITGQNLSARSRFGHHLLSKTDLTGFFATPVELGNGNKKSVVWETFWPAATINPATGAKFNGYASAWVTDAWTGFLHETGSTFIGGAC